MLSNELKTRILHDILGPGHNAEIARLVAGERPWDVLHAIPLVNDVVLGLGRARHIVEEREHLEHLSDRLNTDVAWRFKIHALALKKLKAEYCEHQAAWDKLQDECHHWAIEDGVCILCGTRL